MTGNNGRSRFLPAYNPLIISGIDAGDQDPAGFLRQEENDEAEDQRHDP